MIDIIDKIKNLKLRLKMYKVELKKLSRKETKQGYLLNKDRGDKIYIERAIKTTLKKLEILKKCA